MKVHDSPVTVVSVSEDVVSTVFNCDYVSFDSEYDLLTNSREFTMTGSVNLDHPLFYKLIGKPSARQEWEKAKPKKVVYSNGHTIVTWQDGTITKTHAHDGDECLWRGREAGRNRARQLRHLAAGGGSLARHRAEHHQPVDVRVAREAR